MKILLTGGTGYIGSHTAVELMGQGHEVTLLDNLSNSKADVVDRIASIAGERPIFHEGSLEDAEFLGGVLAKTRPDVVMHFAGLKAVAESVAQPLRYYETNLRSTLTLCRMMLEHQVDKLVFSSSATVYGDREKGPFTEEDPITTATSPYGSTQLYIERILQDLVATQPELGVVLLRYFNPAGAHESAKLGEDPKGTPNNLVPIITQVAASQDGKLTVHGDDYGTPDGTCVRDYIHVMDLARGHVAALSRLGKGGGVHIYNLGSGTGHSVLEVIKAFEEVTGVKVPHRIGPRRPGDIESSYTDPAKALRELNWKTEQSLADICRDAWNWQQNSRLELAGTEKRHQETPVNSSTFTNIPHWNRHICLYEENYPANPSDIREFVNTLFTNGDVIDTDRRSTLVRGQWGNDRFVTKCYKTKKMRYMVDGFVLGRGSLRAWNNIFLLRDLDIPTLQPVALLEERFFRFRGKSYLVTKEINGDVIRVYLDKNNGSLPATLLDSFQKMLKHLYDARLIHGDLNTDNIMITDDGPVLIDLDKMARVDDHIEFVRRFNAEKARFLNQLAHWPSAMESIENTFPTVR